MCSVLWEMEGQLLPSASYLERHGPCACGPDLFLDSSMRRTAAGWLVEVAAEFGLHQETLFLAAALLDRFLSTAKVRYGRRWHLPACLPVAAVVVRSHGAAAASAAGMRCTVWALPECCCSCAVGDTVSAVMILARPFPALVCCCRAYRAHSCSWWQWPACSSPLSMKRCGRTGCALLPLRCWATALLGCRCHWCCHCWTAAVTGPAGSPLAEAATATRTAWAGCAGVPGPLCAIHAQAQLVCWTPVC